MIEVATSSASVSAADAVRADRTVAHARFAFDAVRFAAVAAEYRDVLVGSAVVQDYFETPGLRTDDAGVSSGGRRLRHRFPPTSGFDSLAVMTDYASHWTLDPDVRFLNHGSFGACPRVVLDAQTEFRRRLEAEPVRFMVCDLPDLIDEVRRDLAEFVDADPAGLALVSNATTGVNSVLRSMTLEPGDELLVTDHEYNACRNVLDFVANRARARVVVAALPFPLTHADEVTAAITAKVTPRTRLLLIDHVTSPTALVLPLEKIAAEMHARGVEVLVDGAHAPGMIPLSLRDLGVSYYTGNCHKWMCAPKGAAFLYVREDRRESVRPAVISHGANAPMGAKSRFQLEFDWTGTDDPTPWLAIPTALRFLGSLFPGGWDELRRRNRDLALEARRLLCEKLDVAPPAPDGMIGSMASIPLPDADSDMTMGPFDLDPIQEMLWDDHRIDVPIMPWPAPPKRWLRVSAQAYNRIGEYRGLTDALTSSGAT